MIWFLLGLVWVVSGVASCIYEWTSEFDLDVGDFAICVFFGSLLGFFAVLFIGLPAFLKEHFGKMVPDQVLMEKRSVKEREPRLRRRN